MGVQSTKDITRSDAIDRISAIIWLCKMKNYRKLERMSNEASEADIEYFIDCFVVPNNYDEIENWTNGMLERMMDRKFFRLSEFDNYNVID